jgi:branched-chain amino acid transport system permease protein
MTTVATRVRRVSIADNLGAIVMIALGIGLAVFVVAEFIDNSAILFQTFMKSLALGSLYALLALGFVLIFKATQTVNFSQGALAMCGALFLSFLVVDENIPFTSWSNPIMDIGGPSWLPWIIAGVVALFFAALLGLVVERLAIRPMVGEPIFSVAVITLGLEIVLRVFATDTVKIQFRSIDPPWIADSFELWGARIGYSYIAVMITAAIAFVAVFFFYRSRTGIAMRAVAHDQEAAMAQGINIGRVFAIAWGAGAVLAALGGIFATQPPAGQTGAVDAGSALVAFRALPAVILGGLDSVQGALVGALLIGFAEIFAGQYLSQYQETLGSGYPLVVPYVVMMIGLLVRPYGLFGTPEIRRV